MSGCNNNSHAAWSSANKGQQKKVLLHWIIFEAAWYWPRSASYAKFTTELNAASADILENRPYGFYVQIGKWSKTTEDSIIVTFPVHQFYITDENCLICLLITHQLYAASFVHWNSAPTQRIVAHYHMQQPEFYELDSSVWDNLLCI